MIMRSHGLLVKTYTLEVVGLNPQYKDNFSHIIHLDQSIAKNMSKALTWHCCNPANGMVVVEEWLRIKTQLYYVNAWNKIEKNKVQLKKLFFVEPWTERGGVYTFETAF